jgi:hypothetical protein
MQAVGYSEESGRSLFVLDVTRPDEVAVSPLITGTYFVCLLAWDARQVSASEIRAVAQRLLQAGCAYVCCWGPDCERVHDLFDDSDLELRPDGPWCMSTWHVREPLSEAIWFALFSAWPDDAFIEGCQSVVGVSIGSSAWATELHAAFVDPLGFSARVLAT